MNTKRNINKLNGCLLLCVYIVTTSVSYALTPRPADDQSQPIALVGGIAHIGNGERIERSIVAFDQGKLLFVGEIDSPDLKLEGYKSIDVTGKHIYPGFIVANSSLGLIEVSALRHTRDNQERGSINPNIRSITAFNTDSELIPTQRFNGVLMAQITPSGGLVSGRSSIVQLDAWNWEDASFRVDDGLHINWPSKTKSQFNFTSFTVERVDNKLYQSQIDEITHLFDEAKAASTRKTELRNIKIAAMQGLYSGTMRLYVHTDEAKAMVGAVNFAREHGIHRIVIVGGREALAIAPFLIDHQIPVILDPIHRLPTHDDSDIDAPYRLPSKMLEAGLMIGLGHSSNMNARNLAFIAGTAAAYGLDREQAVSMISLNNAKILGIDDRVGSLEVGKDASLFVSLGDALDMRTNRLEMAFIQGRQIELEATQQQLYQRYHKKYVRMKSRK